jgi:hypothetical protein
VNERNPGGDRGRRSPPAWPEEPVDAPGDGSPEASIFGPVTNDRYEHPHWPGETDGPGSSVFDPTRPTAPSPPAPPQYPGYADRQAHIPPPTPPTMPQYPTAPQYPTPQYPPEPSPDPTRPQPRLPDHGPPPGRSYPPDPGPGRRSRGRDDRSGYDRSYDDRDGSRGRAGRERGGRGRGFPLGAGFFIGASGLACFLLALLVLPWFEAGGREVTLADIRESFTLAATDPASVPGAESGGDAASDPAELAESQARDIGARMAASAIDSGRARYLEIYTETLWWVIAVGVSLSVLFSTILTPKSAVLSLLLGFRRLSGLVTILAGFVHGAALWVVFTGTNAPDPAFGVWLGLGGLGAVLLGCILGPKR